MESRLARARKRKDMTQAGLAMSLGVSLTKVAFWENGYHKMRQDILEEIAAILEVRAAWLAGSGTRVRYGGEWCEIVQMDAIEGAEAACTLDHPRKGFVDVMLLSEDGAADQQKTRQKETEGLQLAHL